MHSKDSETNNKAVIAYVPALHAGYIRFFGAYKDATIFVLGSPYINDFPRLNRDIRALKPEEAVQALSALGYRASVLDELPPVSLFETFDSFVLPDEDVSRDFSEKYLKNKDTTLVNIFLRWDGVFSNVQSAISPDREVSGTDAAVALMKEAYVESKYSADWWRQVGGVLTPLHGEKIYGHIRYFPSDLALDIFGTPRITVDFGERPDLYISMHSEADVITRAAKEGVALEGASLYTTTFPCINCAFLIARSGIKHVYYSEGYSKIDAESVLKNAGVEIVLVTGI